jgi:hypothetical protein
LLKGIRKGGELQVDEKNTNTQLETQTGMLTIFAPPPFDLYEIALPL